MQKIGNSFLTEKGLFERLTKTTTIIDAVHQHIGSPDVFCDSIAAHCDFSTSERIACLSETDVKRRLDLVHQFLLRKIKKQELMLAAEQKAVERFKLEYQSIFLEEQLKQVLNEMGENAPMALYNPIFRGRVFKQNENLVFVLMPFVESFRPIYSEIIKPTLELMGYECRRADDMYGPRPIIEDIWQLINEARLIIADVTGKNANVFYEIGPAHAIGKDVIIITQSLDDMPFDLRHYRCILYEDSVKGTKKLEKDFI